jgi:hypothetical protein
VTTESTEPPGGPRVRAAGRAAAVSSLAHADARISGFPRKNEAAVRKIRRID